MVISTDYKRLFLRGLKWDSGENGQTLLANLKTAARARLTATSAGNFLIGSLANGHSAQYALPMNGRGLSQQDLSELCEQTLILYDSAKLNLGGTPTDDQIFAEMLGLLAPVKSSTNDYTQLRTAGI